MKRRMVLKMALTVMLSTFIYAGNALAAVWFVDNNALPGGNGLSWQTAFNTVQAGINAAALGDDVWVKQGTYRENIIMKDGVALYGHFIGTESSLTQRNLGDNTTVSILDGRQAGSVVTIDNCPSAATTVDGLTIQNGYGQNGGGIYCNNSSPTISNNVIKKNVVINRGSGISVRGSSSPVITNNTITENGTYTSGMEGGGIDLLYPDAAGTRVVHNVISRNNVWSSGGAGISLNGDAEIAYNVIVENSCRACDGAGIRGNGSSAAKIHNNFIARNSTAGSGGGMALFVYSATVTNNTITNNSAGSSAGLGGGGIALGGSVTLANNIISFNSDGIYLPYPDVPYLSHNNVFGNTNGDYLGVGRGATDVSADPLFVDNAVGNYHLRMASPCIDQGDNGAVDNAWIDIDGEPRISNEIVDIGADEFYVYDSTPPTTTMSLDGTLGENGWYWSDVVVTLIATDNGSGVARTEYSFDAGGTWNTYTGPFTVTSEGSTVIDYRSIDSAGNVEPYLWDEVKIDRIAPVVVVSGADPANGATNVSVNQTVTVTFSENVQEGTNFANIKLYRARINPSREVTTLNSVPPVPGNVLYIDPVANLNPLTIYRVVIPAGSVKDMAGHPLAADYPPYSFETAP